MFILLSPWSLTKQRLFFLVAFDGQTLEHGFFYGWDSCTVLVAATHMLKAWSTLYLLVYLDSAAGLEQRFPFIIII